MNHRKTWQVLKARPPALPRPLSLCPRPGGVVGEVPVLAEG